MRAVPTIREAGWTKDKLSRVTEVTLTVTQLISHERKLNILFLNVSFHKKFEVQRKLFDRNVFSHQQMALK